MSADLVGSTAFKQRRGTASSKTDENASPELQPRTTYSLGPSWIEPFAQFYTRFPKYIEEGWNAICDAIDEGKERESLQEIGHPKFWKCIGDELIFEREITAISQCAAVIFSLRYALEKFRNDIKDQYPSLEIKGGAWTAQFPVVNQEVVFGPDRDEIVEILGRNLYWQLSDMIRPHFFRLNPLPLESIDFVGPQMDLGFRILKFSSPRRIVLSADLAYLLSYSRRHPTSNLSKKFEEIYSHRNRDKKGGDEKDSTGFPSDWEFRFLGTHSLKGVLWGTPYPVFWIPGNDDEHLRKEEHLDGVKEIHFGEVYEYCMAFFEHFSKKDDSWFCRPYVATSKYEYMEERRAEDRDDHFDGGDLVAPPSHEMALQSAKNQLKSRLSDIESSKTEENKAGEEGNASATLTADEVRQVREITDKFPKPDDDNNDGSETDK